MNFHLLTLFLQVYYKSHSSPYKLDGETLCLIGWGIAQWQNTYLAFIGL